MFSLFDWLGLDEALLVSNLISAIVILMGSSYVDLHCFVGFCEVEFLVSLIVFRFVLLFYYFNCHIGCTHIRHMYVLSASIFHDLNRCIRLLNLIAQTLTPGNDLTLGENVFVNRVTVRVFLFLRLLNFLQLVNLCRKLFLRLLVALIWKLFWWYLWCHRAGCLFDDWLRKIVIIDYTWLRRDVNWRDYDLRGLRLNIDLVGCFPIRTTKV